MTDSICMNVKRNLILTALPVAFILGGIATTLTGHGFYTVKFDRASSEQEVVTTTVLPEVAPTTAAPAEPVAEPEPVAEAPVPQAVPTTAAPTTTAAPKAPGRVPAKTNVAPGEPSCPANHALTPTGCVEVAPAPKAEEHKPFTPEMPTPVGAMTESQSVETTE